MFWERDTGGILGHHSDHEPKHDLQTNRSDKRDKRDKEERQGQGNYEHCPPKTRKLGTLYQNAHPSAVVYLIGPGPAEDVSSLKNLLLRLELLEILGHFLGPLTLVLDRDCSGCNRRCGRDLRGNDGERRLRFLHLGPLN